MKVLLTGAGGFLGKEIAKKLSYLGHEVFGVSRNFYPEIKNYCVTQFQCDLSVRADYKKIFESHTYDACIHTAAKAGVWGDYNEYYQANFIGTKNLLDACIENNISSFIYTSSPSVVFGKDPISGADETLDYPNEFLTAYAETKSLAEKLVLESNGEKIKTLSLRPHLLYGPGDPHILPRILEKSDSNKLKIIGKGNNTVAITHIENAAEAHIKALEKIKIDGKVQGEAFFINNKDSVNLWDFINKLLISNNRSSLKKKVPMRLAYIIGAVLEILYKYSKKEPPMTRFVALQLGLDHYFSNKKANELLGFYPKEIDF